MGTTSKPHHRSSVMVWGVRGCRQGTVCVCSWVLGGLCRKGQGYAQAGCVLGGGGGEKRAKTQSLTTAQRCPHSCPHCSTSLAEFNSFACSKLVRKFNDRVMECAAAPQVAHLLSHQSLTNTCNCQENLAGQQHLQPLAHLQHQQLWQHLTCSSPLLA